MIFGVFFTTHGKCGKCDWFKRSRNRQEKRVEEKENEIFRGVVITWGFYTILKLMQMADLLYMAHSAAWKNR